MEKTGAKRLASKADVETALKGASIPFKTYDHAVCLNMKDLQEHVKLEHAPHIKNLAYIDKKDNLYLVIASNETQVGKGFWKKVGTSAGNIRMAKEDQMKEVLGILMPGSVNPFSLLNDKDAKRVKAFVVDKKLMGSEFWAFHPMENNATIELKRDDFLNNYVKKVVEIDFVEADLEAPAEEGDAAAAGGKKEGKGGEKKEGKKDEEKKVHHDETEGQTKLGLDHKKADAFPLWYQQLITKGELIEYYDVSGCYILRPWAYAIWEQIQANFDSWIKLLGVENSYFPLFVSEKALNKEKDHVEGFAPEVAWVTKYGTSTLKEPVAVRPTSETIMYPAYAKWITSHRDLPLKLNQWTNVVRWEFKHPTPFIRTREFLWQEGHTAHATCEDADKQVHEILDLYRRVYEELLAVPVVKGQKTEGEKFAGGFYTTTIETWIPTNGRGVQAATSHQLGQNFAKMFEILFEDEKKERQHVWQTSWGLTTRSIGVMIMVHGDDKGLVLPPRVAKLQVVVVPIISKETNTDELIKWCDEVVKELKAAGVRAHIDARDNYSPGWKYNHWELKGVPLRVEVGAKELKNNEIRVVRRFDGTKSSLPRGELVPKVKGVLDEIQAGMFKKAKEALDAKYKEAADWASFMKEVNGGNVVLTPWCKEEPCEKAVKEKSAAESKALSAAEVEVQLTGAAKTLCMPFDQKKVGEDTKCFSCGKKAQTHVLWGRSY